MTTPPTHGLTIVAVEDRVRADVELNREPFTKTGAVVRSTLGMLLAFGALNAFGGGYYGLAGAKDIPREWLEGSPFSDYFVPSLILFVVVGGSLFLAAAAVFVRWRNAHRLAAGAAFIVLGWLAVQVAIIGYVSWMQPATALAAVVVLVLQHFLPPPSAWRREKRAPRPRRTCAHTARLARRA